jgi:hypothetical protein
MNQHFAISSLLVALVALSGPAAAQSRPKAAMNAPAGQSWDGTWNIRLDGLTSRSQLVIVNGQAVMYWMQDRSRPTPTPSGTVLSSQASGNRFDTVVETNGTMAYWGKANITLQRRSATSAEYSYEGPRGQKFTGVAQRQ